MSHTITAAQLAAQLVTPPRRFQCRHIFTDGHRCGSPCLRSEDLCFYHHTSYARRPIPTTDLSQGEQLAAPFTLPIPEDRSAIQVAIGEILNRLASNQLDPRRAGLLLYGLQIASLNLPHARPAAAPAVEQQAIVEEIVTDPNLGTVAPRSELLPIDAPRPNSLIARFLEEIHRNLADTASEAQTSSDPDPDPDPDSDPDSNSEAPFNCNAEPRPVTLSNLQASAARPSPQGRIVQHRRPSSSHSRCEPAYHFRKPSPSFCHSRREPAVALTHSLHAASRVTPSPPHARTRLAILTSACPNPSSSPSSTAGAIAPRPTATP